MSTSAPLRALAVIAAASFGCAHGPVAGSGGSLGSFEATRSEREARAAQLLGGPVSWQTVSFDVTSNDPHVLASSLRAEVQWAACYQYVPATTSVDSRGGRDGGWRVAAEVPTHATGYLTVHADLNANGRCDPSEPVWEFPLTGRTGGHETIALGEPTRGDAASCAAFDLRDE